MLSVKNITKTFGERVAVNDLSFKMTESGVFGLIGTNGAGKTTSIRVILGIMKADSGSAQWNGRPISRDTVRFGYLPEERGIYMKEKVSEQITAEQLKPEIEIDMEINLRDINPKLFRILRQFAPFGPENNVPVFCSRHLIDTGHARMVGTNHLKFSAVSREVPSFPYPCIGFGFADYCDKLVGGEMFDMCYQIDENVYKGQTTLQLNTKDIRLLSDNVN